MRRPSFDISRALALGVFAVALGPKLMSRGSSIRVPDVPPSDDRSPAAEREPLAPTPAARCPSWRRRKLRRTLRRLSGGLLSAIIVVVPAGVFVRESLGQVARQQQVVVPPVRLPARVAAQFGLFKPYHDAIPVLTYHDISDSAGKYSVSPEHLAAQLAMLDAAGFTTITAAQFAHFLDGTGTLPTKPILITFDDGASSAWRVADPLLARYGMHAVLFVITSEIGRHAPYYISSSELRGLRSSGRWDLEAHTDNGHREIVSSPSDQWGPFLTNRMWLTSENRFETLAEYRTRVASDLDRCIAKLRALGVDPHLFAFPFSAATTPTNDPRVIPILFKLVAARFSASLIDSDQHRYVSRVLPNRYELPRFLVRSSTTARGLFEELASHAPFPHTGNLTDPAANWVVDQRALESAMRGQNGLTFAPPTRTWISAHWAPKNALPVRDATLRVVAARLGSAARGSAVTLVVRPDDNTLPATVTVGPSTLRIHGTTSLICSLAPAPSHRLSVTYQGSTLEVAVDDRSAATVQLATTAGSGIGIGAWRDSARSPEPVVRKLIEVSPTAFRIAKARLKCTTDIALPASSRNSRTQPSNGSTHTGDLSSGTPSRRIWRDS